MNNQCRPQDHLFYRIQAYGFSIHDIELYLDTHPCDLRALRLREQLKSEKCELERKYESLFGPLVITKEQAGGDDRWSWTKGPWPWEYRAN